MGLRTGNTFDKEHASNPIERRLVSGFTRSLMNLLPASAERVLEVGCGEGFQLKKVASAIPHAHLVGVDLPDEKLFKHWRSVEADMVCGNALALPFRSSSFDLVLAVEVLEHVPDPAVAVGEISRVARENIILSVPWEPIWSMGNVARGRYVRRWGNTPGHEQRFTLRGFLKLVSEHLVIESVVRPFPWTMVRARVPHASR